MGRLNGNIADDLHEWLRGYSQRKNMSMVAIVEGYLRRLRDSDSSGQPGEGPRHLRVDIEGDVGVWLEEVGDGVRVRVAPREGTDG